LGKARASLASVPCRLTVLDPSSQAEAKRTYVEKLGGKRTAAIGNGRNDRLMLDIAALSIATVQAEGAARDAVLAAHVVVPGAVEALDLLIHPLRLTATLRG
jgi:soluble P-type ATPase